MTASQIIERIEERDAITSKLRDEAQALLLEKWLRRKGLWAAAQAVVVFLSVFLLAPAAHAQPMPCAVGVSNPVSGMAMATWIAPTTDVSGIPLDATTAVAFYNIYIDAPDCTPSLGTPTDTVLAPATAWPVISLPDGVHAIQVTAVNVNGESWPTPPLMFFLRRP